MKQWVIKFIGSLFLIVGLILSVWYYSKKQYNTKVITKEIVKDSLIRDTLYHVKDSLTTEIHYIEKSYIEKKNSIIANDTTADMQFFTKYINDYTRATKDN